MCMQPLAKSFLIYAPPQPPRLSRDCALSNMVALDWFKCCEEVIIIILLVCVCSLQFLLTCVQRTLLLLKQVTRIHTGEGL